MRRDDFMRELITKLVDHELEKYKKHDDNHATHVARHGYLAHVDLANKLNVPPQAMEEISRHPWSPTILVNSGSPAPQESTPDASSPQAGSDTPQSVPAGGVVQIQANPAPAPQPETAQLSKAMMEAFKKYALPALIGGAAALGGAAGYKALTEKDPSVQQAPLSPGGNGAEIGFTVE